MQENTAEKLQRIQSLFDTGKSHAEIAKELGYSKIESYYRYIYRYDNSLNYKKLFNKKGLSIVQKGEPHTEIKTEKNVEDIPQTKENISKAESIVSLISRGIDVREVAKKKRFKDSQDMANYMKSKGYIWNSKEKNYVLVPQEKQVSRAPPNMPKEEGTETMHSDELREIMNSDEKGSCECLERYGEILKLLEDNKCNLAELLTGKEKKGEIPRYIVPGDVKTKSIKIVSTLEHLMNDFCEVANLTQKEMLEVAIIEFLKKYGYEDEVKMSLKL